MDGRAFVVVLGQSIVILIVSPLIKKWFPFQCKFLPFQLIFPDNQHFDPFDRVSPSILALRMIIIISVVVG